jgi:hypothetical protein
MDQLNVTGNMTGNATFVDTESIIAGVGDNMLVAYVAIMVMALVPIYIGSFQSLKLSTVQTPTIHCNCLC